MEYPFLIRGPTRIRLVKVVANSYANALNKVLQLHQNKFIKTQFAKRMVLVEAKSAAQKESKAQKGKMFYVTVNNKDGEVDYGSIAKAGHTTHNQFLNGKEVKLDAPAKTSSLAQTIKQTNKDMSTVKKEVAKAATKKVGAKPVMKSIAGAKQMKASDLGKAIKNGAIAHTATGRRLSPSKLLHMSTIFQVSSKKNKDGVTEYIKH